LSPTLSILVVNPDSKERDLIISQLGDETHHMLAAESGEQAWASLSSERVDLVLLDTTSPDFNGLQFLARIQKQAHLKNIPVILMLVASTPIDKVRAFDEGAVDIIVKPFDNDELRARVRSHLRQKKEQIDQIRATREITVFASRKITAAEQRFDVLVNNSYDLVSELDDGLFIAYCSPNHRDMLHYPIAQLTGSYWPEFVHPDDRDRVVALLEQLHKSCTNGRVRHRFLDSQGKWRWFDTSGSGFSNVHAKGRLLLCSRDVTQLKQTEDRLDHLALHDPLTDLGNRQHFVNELTNSLARNESGAVIYIDLDNFKLINHTQGVAVGDQILISLATLLASGLTSRHLVCRLEGDEFCILLRNVDEQLALAETLRLLDICSAQSLGSSSNPLKVSLSAGIALLESNLDQEEIRARAEAALYAAKSGWTTGNLSRVRLYKDDNEEMQKIRISAQWYNRIKEACRDSLNAFEIWYQPIRFLASEQLFCEEALLRIRTPDGILHFPPEFIGAAERYHLVTEVDRMVIHKVFNDMKMRPELSTSINLAGVTVADPSIKQYIIDELTTSGISPTRVIFEITETSCITNLANAKALVTGLREIGCRFALDDFGSGFSSLMYLKNLPVDIVKIDGRFISRITESKADLVLLRSINDIAHLLGKTTVAENVESAHILEMLQLVGVDYVQGYHIGRPKLK